MSATSIATLAARIARMPERDVHPGMPFSVMGLDSAGTIELAFAIEEMLGIDLPPELVSESVDARMLADRIDAHRRGPAERCTKSSSSSMRRAEFSPATGPGSPLRR